MMPPNSRPLDVPIIMDGDNVSVDSDDEDFVMLEMEDAESGGEEDDNITQGEDGLSGYMPLMNSEDPSGNCVLFDQGTLVSADNEEIDMGVHPYEAQEQASRVDITGSDEDIETRDRVTRICSGSLAAASSEVPFNIGEPLSSDSPRSGLQIMSTEHANLVKKAMASITLPTANIPDWANEIPEEKWKESLFSSITKREEKDC